MSPAASAYLLHARQQGEMLFDHASGQFRDISLVEIVMDLEIGLLNVEELPVSLDFGLNVIVIELGPST